MRVFVRSSRFRSFSAAITGWPAGVASSVIRGCSRAGEQQCAPVANAGAQLLIRRSSGARTRLSMLAHESGCRVGARVCSNQRVPPGGERQRTVVVGHDTLADATQDDRRRVKIAQRAQPGFTVCMLCKGEDIGCERIEELDRVVERHGLQRLEQGSEGCRTPWLVQHRQIGRLGGAGAARQSPEWGRRQVGDGTGPRPWPRMASMRSRCRSNSVGERRLGVARRSSRVASMAP